MAINLNGTGSITGLSSISAPAISDVPAGTASAPAFSFTGDSNTGIYSPGADQVAISTNGTGRLFVDSSGRVGVGTSPSYALDVQSGDIRIKRSATDDGAVYFGSTTDNYIYGSKTANNFVFATNGSERMRLDSSGRLGIGTSNPFTNFEVQTTANGTAAAIYRQNSTGGGSIIKTNNGYSSTVPIYAFWYSDQTGIGNPVANEVSVIIAATESARFDSSGRFLVGTTAGSVNLPLGANIDVVSAVSYGPQIRLRAQSNDLAPPYFIFHKNRGASGFPLSGDFLGNFQWESVTGGANAYINVYAEANFSGTSTPTNMAFGTSDYNQTFPSMSRMIIKPWGTVQFGTVSGLINSSNYGFLIAPGGYFTNAANINGTGAVFESYGSAGKFAILGNGNAINTNGSYTAISDIKLKENIVDANSQWDDIKALRVVNYNFKPDQGRDTHKQLGVIAQEVELVAPGLVNNIPDWDYADVPVLDEDGNPILDDDGNTVTKNEKVETGTFTKTVNYSVLYMKAVKALQEAMERIETLEAKVTALESA